MRHFPQQAKSILYLVEVRAVFLKIGDIDTLNEKFYAEAFVEANWIDFSIDSKTVKYDPAIHWNPNLYIMNSLGELKQQVWYNQYSIREYSERQEVQASAREKADRPAGALKDIGSVISERRRITGQFWQT